ncbi:hypothetical protein Ait01nite_089390 [Actinoplanes italicus]|uniref:Uncharacterized protein n=1 Tax=Actinoplanes italicus TaxID=113567 RepID=A0A2T0JIC6_9ACTN|nr:hypothetical protein [Actinoplanes italicus]PRX07355.1 hypothetical protein CLV67_14230 [Actinoplanes italicus]GIE35894.1 hypothetical protein Ait01nite_089390 [Actinoplanes italicus]
MSKTVEQIVAEGRLPEETVKICLRADLVAEHERLDTELERLLETPVLKFGGDPRRAQLAEQIRALEEQMAESTIEFRMRAMPKRRWRRLVAEHPPRRTPDDEVDPRDDRGVNSETFLPAIVKASTVEPVLSDEAWLGLLGHTETEAEALEAAGKADEVQDGKLSSRQHELLQNAAWNINRDAVAVPFSPAASRLTQSSAAR